MCDEDERYSRQTSAVQTRAGGGIGEMSPDRGGNANRRRDGGAARRTRRSGGRLGLPSLRSGLFISTAVALIAVANGASAADLSPMVTKAPPSPGAYDWSGYYLGGNIGYSWGTSDWSAPPASGTFDLYNAFDSNKLSGSFAIGVQAGYNYMFKNRVVLGAEIEFQAPAWPDVNTGLTTGGQHGFVSPVYGPMNFSETVLDQGTARVRLGYAPGNWLFYATGGFAWTYNQQTMTQLSATGGSASPFVWRLGYAAGVGAEVPFMPNWTAKFEYLYTGYPDKTVTYPDVPGPAVTSNWNQQSLRLGVNYHFNGDASSDSGNSGLMALPMKALKKAEPNDSLWSNANDTINFHAQATFVEQAYPTFSAPYTGPNSAFGAGEGRETFDSTLFAGLRLWQGAEFWVNPEIDQGFGFGNTHGFAAFPSAESYKLGSSYPYARIPRYFVRQTIDLGGDSEKVDADLNQFAGTRTEDRLVLTVGKFGAVDIFDTNKYANNPKTDFLNWAGINAGTFDYAGDAWGLTYGAAAELYKGSWTFRLGLFDLSTTPAGGDSPLAYGVDPTFQQYELFGEIEKRWQLWEQPGKLKITGYLERGRMGSYADAIAYGVATGGPANINAVRQYTSRPGVSANWEQSLTDTIATFGRVGWADPNHEPWDFTDIDEALQLGLAFNGKIWGRPNDTIGSMLMVNGISKIHQEFLNDGGLGILVGDGQLPHYGNEVAWETYYSYALTDTTKLSVDYQFLENPGYNRDRGPANIFAGRIHWQY
jgi:high affinity Mn2+ porin